MATGYEQIRFDREDDIGWLTLARPERLNAQTPRMWAELRALGEAVADTGLRVLVVRGEGRAFSSGLDLREHESGGALDRGADLGASDGDQVARNIMRVQGSFRWIYEAPFVSVAAVRGYALGAGMQLALACDLRIGADDSVFSHPELSIGVVPDMGGTGWLPRLVGPAVAKEIMLLGDRIPATEALRLGILNQVVPVDELDKTVEALVARLAGLPPIAVRYAKAAVDAETLEDSYRLAAEGSAACLRSEDYRETMRALRDRRAPAYRGC